MPRIHEPSTHYNPLAGNEPKYCSSATPPGDFLLRRNPGCAAIRHEYLWCYEVSILSAPLPMKSSSSASVTNLMPTDIQRDGLPTKWPGPSRQKHPPPWPLANVAGMSLIVTGSQW